MQMYINEYDTDLTHTPMLCCVDMGILVKLTCPCITACQLIMVSLIYSRSPKEY